MEIAPSNPPPDQALRVIVLSQGADDTGKHFWAYIAVPPEKFLLMKVREASGEAFDLEEYGEPMMWGIGENPPEEILEFMRVQFGASPDYDDALFEEMHRLVYQHEVEEFKKQQEESGESGDASDGTPDFIKKILAQKKPDNGD